MTTEFDDMRLVLSNYDDALEPSTLVAANTANSHAVFHFAQQRVRKEREVLRLAEKFNRDRSNGAAKSELDQAKTIRAELDRLIAGSVEMYQRDG